MKHATAAAGLIVVLLVMFLVGACASPPAEKFYVLTADARPASAADVAGNMSHATQGATDNASAAVRSPQVSVGVTLAEMVDRPQLVIQLADNRVLILEQQRWAEPLGSEIQRVMELNLLHQLGSASGAMPAMVRVIIDVRHFESIFGKQTNIELQWRASGTGMAEGLGGRAVATEPVLAPGYDALVAAHSRALARISGEIAGAIIRGAR